VSKGKKDSQPNWRPNFVNNEELPDIKAIRTDFIVNFFAVALALGVVSFLLQREYKVYSLAQTVAGMEQQIRAADAEDAASLKLSEDFRSSAQYIIEVQKFFDAPMRVHEFLYGLSLIRPDDLIYNSVSWGESVTKQGGKNVVSYTINIKGDAKNLTIVGDFKKMLIGDPLFQIPGFELQINETLQGRDDKTGIFPYRLEISLIPSSGTKAGGAS
jgi:hypothetical protein